MDALRRDLRQYTAAQRDSVYMQRVPNSDLGREFRTGSLGILFESKPLAKEVAD